MLLSNVALERRRVSGVRSEGLFEMYFLAKPQRSQRILALSAYAFKSSFALFAPLRELSF